MWPAVTNKLPGDTGKDYSVYFKGSGAAQISDWRTLRLRYSEPDYVAQGEWTRLTFGWVDKRYRNRVWYRSQPSMEVPALPWGRPTRTHSAPRSSVWRTWP